MTKTKNPLSKFSTYRISHLLIAFDNSEAAANFVPPVTGVGLCGAEVKVPVGKAYVVINENEDVTFNIKDIRWSYDFYSPLTPNTTISAGGFTVVDGMGNQFPSFLRKISKKLKVAESKITYYLLSTVSGNVAGKISTETVQMKPLIFQIVDTATGFRQGMNNLFSFNFVFLYNSLAQLPQYGSLSQFTITNSENSPARTLPSVPSLSGIVSRAENDRNKSGLRQSRLNQSAPMRTLNDLFKGFEAELKDMTYPHNGQLQAFMRSVRPSSVDKLKTPKPTRTKRGEGLKLDYNVKLDDTYLQYPVNNRNLMTEQVEMNQTSPGIESMTLPSASTLYSGVDALMKTSAKTGKDVADGFGYKTVVASVYTPEGVLRNTIRVAKYKIPRNKEGSLDTGKHAEGAVKPLELAYMEGPGEIFGISFATAPNSDISVLEEEASSIERDKPFASSQIEQITFERGDTDDFMRNGFAGLRSLADPVNYGLESAISGAQVDALKYRFAVAQSTLTVVNMAGNSDLYSDLARNPLAVAEGRDDGARLYKFPEVYPMYMKLRVRIAHSQAVGHTRNVDADQFWYHTYHYHLTGVTNSISGGRFIQTLRLLSADDAI